ncbi:MAG: hypothetical protein ACI9ON_000780 [Limisphaerales bacterium]|jgi:hypothetical protein
MFIIDDQKRKKFYTISNRYTYHYCRAFAEMSHNAPIFPSSYLFLSCLFCVAMLSGCVTPSNSIPETPIAPEPVELAPLIRPADLNLWLNQAEDALKRDQLTYPEQDSAYSFYQRILALDPLQEDAQWGLEHIVEHYVALSMRALERRQFASAKSMLARARIILPNHPSIEPSAEQIRLILSADRQIMKLSQPELAAESEALTTALGDFATDGDRQCRFTISAKNDGQGRWIYQMLSKGLEGTRLRAQLSVRLPASIERLCFN